MAHYGDDTEDSSVSSGDDSNDENEYFDTKPRKINFDDEEHVNDIHEDSVEAPKRKRKRLFMGDANAKMICDVCNKSFEKQWALNAHMLLHSG